MRKILGAVLLATSFLASSTLSADMVNINKASAEALQTNLKGVGEKKAQAIVDYRTEHGEFKSLEEIKEVPGIGEGIYKKISADISLTEGVTEVAAKPGQDKADEGEKATAEKQEAKTKDKTDKISDKSAANTGKS